MPGDMGHGIAKVLVESNFKVLTFLKGRSIRTLKLANEARVINIDNFENFLNTLLRRLSTTLNTSSCSTNDISKSNW